MFPKGGRMDEKKVRFMAAAGLVVVAFAAGFFTGYFRANGRNSLRHGIELEQIRAEQRRTEEQYQQLRVNYTRERELNSRIRGLIENSTGILQSNDDTISGLRKQISLLREKIQELKDIFSGFYPPGGTGGVPDNRPADEKIGS
jgi:chromosome segregation ATPase